jgi:molybdopterin converting factor small subunit/tRNA threonylcarbamoyladenosine modification (KEOPS) complex Cgi121 subunit
MITVKLLGGAKRIFSSDKLEIEKESMTVTDLLGYLQRSTPANLPSLDVSNILVVVNGIDSSALEGHNTCLKNGDVISIIPVVHGGNINRVSFRAGVDTVELIRLGKNVNDSVNFLEIIRRRYPDLIVQGVRSKYIVSIEHAKKVVAISLAARKADTLLSNKIETDILMRFAITRQINDAINKAGLQKDQEFILILIGKKSSITRLLREMMHLIKPFKDLARNSNFIKNEYSITKKQLDCVISKRPLEDLLSEKSAVLFH